MKTRNHFVARITVLALMLCTLALASNALAQTIHIEMQGGQPVFVDRPCDNEKGKVCNPKDSSNNINSITWSSVAWPTPSGVSPESKS